MLGQLLGMLGELGAQAPKLKVEVRDRLLAPKLAKELRATQDGVIILARGGVTYSLNIGTEIEHSPSSTSWLMIE